MSARDTDRTHHCDLAGAFVHGDRHESRHQQETDEQTYTSEYHCQLPEIAESLIDLRDCRGDGDRRNCRDVGLDPLAHAIGVCSFAYSHHEVRCAVVTGWTFHVLESHTANCRH